MAGAVTSQSLFSYLSLQHLNDRAIHGWLNSYQSSHAYCGFVASKKEAFLKGKTLIHSLNCHVSQIYSKRHVSHLYREREAIERSSLLLRKICKGFRLFRCFENEVTYGVGLLSHIYVECFCLAIIILNNLIVIITFSTCSYIDTRQCSCLVMPRPILFTESDFAW